MLHSGSHFAHMVAPHVRLDPADRLQRPGLSGSSRSAWLAPARRSRSGLLGPHAGVQAAAAAVAAGGPSASTFRLVLLATNPVLPGRPSPLCRLSSMAALTANVSAVAPSSQRVASTGALRQRAAPSAAAPRGRVAATPTRAVAAPETRHHQGPVIVNGQVLHSATKEQLDVVANMDKYAEEQVLPILKPTEKCWQPQDFLPDPESPDFADAVRVRKERGGWGWARDCWLSLSGERAGGF